MDETNGWIFSDEYHTWQDGRSHGNWRSAEFGCFSIKECSTRPQPNSDSGRWPNPWPFQDLDKI